MSPNKFSDIIPPEKRTIRNITAPHARTRTSVSMPRSVVDDDGMPGEVHEAPPGKKRRVGLGRYGKMLLWGILAVVVALVGLSLLFSGARIVVKPLFKDVSVDGTFTAYRAGEGNGQFEYQIMKQEKALSATVPALGETHAEEFASGSIIIFNEYSTAPQRLVKNTRFETNEGLIYRIADSVTVPGERTEGGKTIPGSVEVKVYADVSGGTYNIGLTDFTIPGFKGDPRYEDFYARSKTPMTGGFVGVRPAVEEETLKKATAELETKLREALLEEARAQKPDSFYFFENLIEVEIEPAVVTSSGDDAQVSVAGTIYTVLFGEDAFAALLASELVPGYDSEPVYLADASAVTIALADSQSEPIAQAKEISFNAKGDTRIIWSFSEEQLKQDLAGRPKEALPTILSGYGSIAEARAIFRPFWKQSFPETPGDIEVEVVLPE